MKKLFLILVLMLPLFVTAEDIILSRDSKATGISIVSDKISERGVSTLTLECHIAKLSAEVVSTEQGNFTLLSIPRFHSSSKIGAPSLPMMNQLIEIPFGAKLNVRVLSSEEQEYSLKDLGIVNPLMPRQPSAPKDGTRLPFEYERGSYSENTYQQEEAASFVEVGMLRHIRLGLLKVAPIAYNPVQGKIKVYNNISIEISLPEADLARTAEIQERYYSPYFDFAGNNVLRPASLSNMRGTDITRYPVTYVIVADRMFANDLEAFVDWKVAKGFKVIEAYTDVIGKTTAEIKAYLHKLYNESTPAPTFVLFVGDTTQVPSFAGTTGSHVTDLYYVAVTPDNIPDMYTGRFSANTSAELIPQIEKTLEYEMYAFADPSFLANTVLIAGWDSGYAVEWGWPQINYATKYYFNKDNGYTKVNAYLSAGSHQNESQIVSLVGNGVGYLNYTAHGSNTSWADPSFTISQVNALGNKGKYPLVVGNCCLTNKFEIATCFGEAWLRARDRGAIGYIGGSNSTYWDEDLWWGNGNYPIVHPNSQGLPPARENTGMGAYDAAFIGGFVSNAGMMLAGNLAVEESTSPRKKYYWEVYHLMGDPSVMLYWGIPKKMSVTHEFANGVLTVKAEPKAYVGVSLDNKLVAATLTNESGEAKITPNVTGTVTIVITKQNREPYKGTVVIK